MSPSIPTLRALNSRLNKAHRRIRELEAREAELLAQIENGTLTRLIPSSLVPEPPDRHSPFRRANAGARSGRTPTPMK